MRQTLFFSLLTLMTLFYGCGQIEDVTATGSIEYENGNYDPNQNNTCYSDYENSAGCFGNSQYFGNEKATSGIWSIYTSSNNYLEYDDKYLYSVQLMSDGSLKKRDGTKNYYYRYSEVWGVNNEGSILTIDPTTSYTITASRTGSCYTVSSSGQSYRMCNESLIDSASQNSSGYYGADLKFGNNDLYGNYSVVGSWSIDGTTITLNADGTTSTGYEWGLSQDAKVITIDGISYMVYIYPDNGCIETYEMSGDYPTEPKTLCRL